MNGVRHAVAVNAEFIQVVGFDTDGRFIHIDAEREVAEFPDAGEDADGEDDDE